MTPLSLVYSYVMRFLDYAMQYAVSAAVFNRWFCKLDRTISASVNDPHFFVLVALSLDLGPGG